MKWLGPTVCQPINRWRRAVLLSGTHCCHPGGDRPSRARAASFQGNIFVTHLVLNYGRTLLEWTGEVRNWQTRQKEEFTSVGTKPGKLKTSARERDRPAVSRSPVRIRYNLLRNDFSQNYPDSKPSLRACWDRFSRRSWIIRAAGRSSSR